MILLGFVYLILLWSPTVESLRFFLPGNVRRCVKDNLHADVLVKGEYDLSEASVKTKLTVTDVKGQTLFQKDDAKKGRFAFTTETFDMIDVCFETHLPHGEHSSDREVYLNLKHGVEAKSYDEIAHAEKLKPLEVELRYLEDLASSITVDFDTMDFREQTMRDTNESTSTRLLYMGCISLLTVIILAAVQVLYMHRYFKSKKLIE